MAPVLSQTFCGAVAAEVVVPVLSQTFCGAVAAEVVAPVLSQTFCGTVAAEWHDACIVRDRLPSMVSAFQFS